LILAIAVAVGIFYAVRNWRSRHDIVQSSKFNSINTARRCARSALLFTCVLLCVAL
jgi:hypothetical protein